MNPFEPTNVVWIPVWLGVILGLIFGVTRVWGWLYDQSLQWFTRRKED
jgi:hypothetical protein